MNKKVGETIQDALRSLVSYIKLMNLTVMATDAPIQALFDNEFLEKVRNARNGRGASSRTAAVGDSVGSQVC